MRKLGVLLCLAFVSALPASAQMKLAGTETCAKPQVNYSVEVGDRAGHSLMVQKTTCLWTEPVRIAGIMSKDAVDVSTVDALGDSASQRGYSMNRMSNGDTFTVHYRGLVRMRKDGSATYSGRWSFVEGSGELHGIHGGGTYRGSGAADGSGKTEVFGHYTLPSAMGAAKPKPRK